MQLDLAHKPIGSGLAIAWPLTHPADWKDPECGLQWSRKTEDILASRLRIIQGAEVNSNFRRGVLQACKQSFAFWADHFVWSMQDNAWKVDGAKLVVSEAAREAPWIGWPINDVIHAAHKYGMQTTRTLVIPKARETRVTWAHLLEVTHMYLFFKQYRSMVMSRAEELVDANDADSLFSRLRYVYERLPWWMKPPGHRDTFKSFINDMGSGISGKATTEHAGVSGRYVVQGFDEAARIRALGSLVAASMNTSNTRWLISTPLGAGYFKQACFNPANIVVPIGYHNHPQKGLGRKWCVDEDGIYTGTRGKPFWWCPYIEEQVITLGRAIREDIGPNEMIDFTGGEGAVFDASAIAKLMAAARSNPPLHTGRLRHAEDGHRRDKMLRERKLDGIQFEKADSGATLLLWCELVNNRPPQNTRYVAFADVSTGISASNSAITVIDCVQCKRVATWVSSSTDPVELSRVLVMLGLWFGGTDDMMTVGWERNGPGLTVGKWMQELRYPKVYTDDKGEMGWWNDGKSKRRLAQNLSAAYARGKFHETDPAVLEEASDWIYGPGDTDWVGPAMLRVDGNAKSTHGDRVVATMGAWMMCEQTLARNPKPEIYRNETDRIIHAMETRRQAKPNAYDAFRGLQQPTAATPVSKKGG